MRGAMSILKLALEPGNVDLSYNPGNASVRAAFGEAFKGAAVEHGNDGIIGFVFGPDLFVIEFAVTFAKEGDDFDGDLPGYWMRNIVIFRACIEKEVPISGEGDSISDRGLIFPIELKPIELRVVKEHAFHEFLVPLPVNAKMLRDDIIGNSGGVMGINGHDSR